MITREPHPDEHPGTDELQPPRESRAQMNTPLGGKARCAPLYTAQKATTALSRPGLRAGKRASMPQTLHTPPNRAFPPEPFN